MLKKMKIAMLLFAPIALYGLYVIGVIIFGTVTNYSPDAEIDITAENVSSRVATDSTFTFMIWNVGYGGLGAESDFFYDGGKMVRPEEGIVSQYVDGINEFLETEKETDFILLQEVDIDSKRSYGTNEFAAFGKTLGTHERAHALNYKVKYVPMPLTTVSPMGKVHSGLATYSKYQSENTTRYQFPGNYGWPKSVFMLDRCFLIQRIPHENGKEIIVINSHNSAYDDGTLKIQQMEYMKDILLTEYEKGNYVIVGADWNQCPPDFAFDSFSSGNSDGYAQTNIEADFLPEWQWVFDDSVPTNRKLSTPYTKGETFVTLIDFFLVSPNVKVENVEGVDLDFKYSDHQPVKMKISLL
ncbi:MAG: endonuclease/exonuclease/phosphatase family protein [Chitinophagales bacterium]